MTSKLTRLFAITVATLALLSFGALTTVHAEHIEGHNTQDGVVQDLNRGVGGGGNNTLGIPNANRTVTDSTLNAVLSNVFLAAGGLSITFIAVGGLRYVLSEGNDQKIKQAKDTITYSVVGVVVALSGWVIVRFVLGVVVQ